MGMAIFSVLLLSSPVIAQESRQETILDAAELAPANLRVDEPAPGKWWLKRDAKDWGAPKGNILLTGRITGEKGTTGEWQVTPADRFVAYRVPELVVDPKVEGWHRIYVGLLH